MNDYSFNLLDDSITHHGILGMKHGQNRYQLQDRTWTEEGLARRREREPAQKAKIREKWKKAQKLQNKADVAQIRANKSKGIKRAVNQAKANIQQFRSNWNKSSGDKAFNKSYQSSKSKLISQAPDLDEFLEYSEQYMDLYLKEYYDE